MRISDLRLDYSAGPGHGIEPRTVHVQLLKANMHYVKPPGQSPHCECTHSSELVTRDSHWYLLHCKLTSGWQIGKNIWV